MPEPAYQRNNVTLYLGDCHDVLRSLPSGSVDAVVTDPPYMLGSAATRKSADKPMGWSEINNASHWYRAWLSEAWRATADDGCLWVFANIKSLPVLSCAVASIGGMHPISTLVWDREWPSVGSMRGLRQTYELVVLYGKPGFAIVDRSVPDIWRCKWGGHKPTGHASEKPQELIGRILATSGIGEDKTVLDPFMGSGTTGAVAIKNRCRFIGCEIEQPWFEFSRNRIDAAFAETPLFA